ncbi:MAG: GAF domain-containing protein [Bacteroidia bacterium]|nr:GAF domain-containing protein [Bacteroidia bacterium]
MSGLLNVHHVLQASQAISAETSLGGLLKKSLEISIEHGGAQVGCILIHQGDRILLGSCCHQKGKTEVPPEPVPVSGPAHIPQSLINYVARERDYVVLNDVQAHNPFRSDPYFKRNAPTSLMCLPMVSALRLVGVIYLEKKYRPGPFSCSQVGMMKMLSSQIGVSILNALLMKEFGIAEPQAESSPDFPAQMSLNW